MESGRLNRRKFLGLFTAAGSLAFVPSGLIKRAYPVNFIKIPDISVVKSSDYYQAAIETVNMLGGINKFVKKDSKVGILINGGFKNKGTYTNPDISLAIIKMCYDAGASEVMIFRADDKSYWSQAKYYSTHSAYLEKVTHSNTNTKIKIEKGVILKEAEIVKELLELDTLINMPVGKHHDGAMITCCLKNMMGLTTRSTNAFFHTRESDEQVLTSNEHLAQCIADLNLIRKPDLCIIDSTVFILNNGPFGPGELKQEDKIIAGTDPVAMDTYFAKIFGLAKDDVLSTVYAAKHGIGQNDLSKIIIEEKLL
jgi:uncharacterized protein (DUF362 family)